MSSYFAALPAATKPILCMLSICSGLGGAACGGGQAPAPETAAPSAVAPADAPLTAARCEAAGGKVVGDIGDGAIHRPEYRCVSGKAPLGSIVAESAQPVAVEGAVCCP